MNVELGGKRLDLLKEAHPGIVRVAFIRTIESPSLQTKEVEAAARALGLQLQIVETKAEDFESAFLTMAKERVDAFTVISSPRFLAERKRIVNLAAKSGLPAVYPQSEYVEAGGLMAYGIFSKRTCIAAPLHMWIGFSKARSRAISPSSSR
jgi:putative ABC transport system substrate-binding protein